MTLHLQPLRCDLLTRILLGAGLFLVPLSCVVRDPSSGTAVGNPGGTALRTGPVTGLPWARASMEVSWIMLTGCDGGVEKVDLDQTLDLLGGDPLELPTGSWCKMKLKSAGPLVLEGTAASGAKVSLALNLAVVSFSGEVPVDGAGLVVELGGPNWVADAGYDPVTGADLAVAVGDSEEPVWSAALLGSSAVYLDTNEDGEINDEERANGVVEVRDEEADDDEASEDAEDFGEGEAEDTGVEDAEAEAAAEEDTGADDAKAEDTADEDTADEDTDDEDTDDEDTDEEDTDGDDTGDDGSDQRQGGGSEEDSEDEG